MIAQNFQGCKQKLLVNHTGTGSVYDHVSKLLYHMATNPEENGLDQFEIISREIKMNKELLDNTLGGNSDGEFISPKEIVKHELFEQSARNTLLEQLFGQVEKKDASEEDESGSSSGEVLFDFEKVPDLVQQAIIFSQLGFHIDSNDAFFMAASLARFCKEIERDGKLSVEGRLCFHAKFQTSGDHDYFVFKGTVNNLTDAEEERDPGIEPEVNKTRFFCSTSIYGPWNILPEVSSSLLKTAKEINIGFSGNLDEKIHSYPVFDVMERDYVACVAKIIESECTVVPKDYYKQGEEEGSIIENSEFGSTELETGYSEKGGYQLFSTPLDQNGRYIPIQTNNSEDSEEPEKPNRLRDIDENLWDVSRLYEGNNLLKMPSNLYLLKQKEWAGYIFAMNPEKPKEFVSFYVGSGMRANSNTELFREFCMPPEIATELPDVEEQSDVLTPPPEPQAEVEETPDAEIEE